MKIIKKLILAIVVGLTLSNCSVPDTDDTNTCPGALYVSYRQAYLTDIDAEFTAEDQTQAQNEFLLMLAVCIQVEKAN